MATNFTQFEDVNETTATRPNFKPIRFGYFVGIGIIIPVGFIFNVLSIIVLVRSRNLRQSTTGMYLIALAVADTLFLIGELLRWLDTDRHVQGYTFLTMSDASCQFVFSLRYGAKLTSAWITVAITAERFYIVSFPLRATAVCTKRLATIAICLVYAVCFVLGCFPVFTIGLGPLAGEIQCLITDGVWYERASWVVLRVGSLLLPGLVVVVLTTLIIVNLLRTNIARQQTLSSRTGSQIVRVSMEKQLTAMLLAVALTFIALRLPYTILFYINEYKEEIWSNLDQYVSFQIYVATKIADLLATTNYAVNFFLYCLTGSTFRSQLRRLFGYEKKCVKSRKWSTSALTHNTAISNEKVPLSVIKPPYNSTSRDNSAERCTGGPTDQHKADHVP